MPKSTWVVPADTFRAFCWIVALVDNFNFDFHIDRKMVRKAARKFLVLGKKRPEENFHTSSSMHRVHFDTRGSEQEDRR